ncbi:hypothetical protein ACFPRL_29135 [Pseudoclavibacter helvolus]
MTTASARSAGKRPVLSGIAATTAIALSAQTHTASRRPHCCDDEAGLRAPPPSRAEPSPVTAEELPPALSAMPER